MRSLVVTAVAVLFFLATPVARAGRATTTIAPGRIGGLNPAKNGTYALKAFVLPRLPRLVPSGGA